MLRVCGCARACLRVSVNVNARIALFLRHKQTHELIMSLFFSVTLCLKNKLDKQGHIHF